MNAVSADAEVPPEFDKRIERRWRLRSLLALVILLPATLVEMSYQSVISLLGNEDLVARDVAWGSAATFGGSEWRLADLRGAMGMAGLPENAVPVLADFTVKIGDPDLENLWLGCKVMLIDADGRRWFPTSAVGLRLPADVTSCNSAIFSGAKQGDVLRVSETFLVPQDATRTIRPGLGLSSERPYFLRFERPPS